MYLLTTACESCTLCISSQLLVNRVYLCIHSQQLLNHVPRVFPHDSLYFLALAPLCNTSRQVVACIPSRQFVPHVPRVSLHDSLCPVYPCVSLYDNLCPLSPHVSPHDSLCPVSPCNPSRQLRPRVPRVSPHDPPQNGCCMLQSESPCLSQLGQMKWCTSGF